MTLGLPFACSNWTTVSKYSCQTIFLWNWCKGLLNWQFVQSALQKKRKWQMWDDSVTHIRFKTLRLAYEATKWLSYIQSPVHVVCQTCTLCCGHLVILQFDLYAISSSRGNHNISAFIKPISSSNLPHPPLTMIYIPLSPPSNFLHLRSHLSSVQATETGCGVKFVTQVLLEILSEEQQWCHWGKVDIK